MRDAASFVPHTVCWAEFIALGLHRGIEAGCFYWIFFGVGAMCGPVLAGFVAERLGFYRSVTGGYGIKAAFVALPILSQHPVALAASAVVVGAMTPGISALASGRVAELNRKSVVEGKSGAGSVDLGGARYL